MFYFNKATIVPRKTLSIACYGRVDISGIIDVMSHSLFQKLDGRTQLAWVRKVYPSAVQTRLSHSIGVAEETRLIVEELYKKSVKNGLTEQECTDLIISGLLHDLGHPPYSHPAENILGRLIDENNPATQHTKTIEFILSDDEFMRRIRDAGGNVESIISILSKDGSKAPHHKIVTDKSIGADKLAYTRMDAFHAEFHQSAPKTDELRHYLIYSDGVYGVEEKAESYVIDQQKFYVRMYEKVYLRKLVQVIERMLQRAIDQHVNFLAREQSEKHFQPSAIKKRISEYAHTLWMYDEANMQVALENSPCSETREYMRRIIYREPFKPAVVLKLEPWVCSERRAGKSIKVLPLSYGSAERFLAVYNNAREVTRLEDYIAESIGLERGMLIVQSPVRIYKIVPSDVNVFTVDSVNNLLLSCESLFSRNKDRNGAHEQFLKQEAERIFAIRVAVPSEKREEVCRKADQIKRVIEAYVER